MMGIATFIGYAALALALAAALIWLLQARLLFYPMKHLAHTPTDWGMDYQNVSLTTDDALRLHGWFVSTAQRRSQPPQVLLFLHGNAGNISHRGDSIAIFDAIGLDVLIIDYRGYGASEGSPSEQGLYKDASAAWRWLTRERGLAPEDIVVFGRSLGAAVAVELAARTRPGGLIVESGFDQIAGLARTHYPLLSRFVPLRYRFASVERIPLIACPVLVLHSPSDEIVPHVLGRRLFDAAPQPKRFFDLTGGHNDGFLRSQPDYQFALQDFLASLRKSDPAH